MTTSSRPYHHGNLRDTLLDAAERMLDAEVSRRFSLRELAREAGVSHAAPYRHFRDREQLVVALAERWMRRFVTVQVDALGSTDPRENLLALGSAYVGYAAAHPSRFLTLFDPTINRPGDPPSEVFGALVEEHTALLHTTVAAAAAGGVVAGDDPGVAAALWSQAHGLATLTILGFLPADRTREVLSALLLPTPRGPAAP